MQLRPRRTKQGREPKVARRRHLAANRVVADAQKKCRRRNPHLSHGLARESASADQNRSRPATAVPPPRPRGLRHRRTAPVWSTLDGMGAAESMQGSTATAVSLGMPRIPGRRTARSESTRSRSTVSSPGVQRAGSVPDPTRPADPRLLDRFGRTATDLRVSVIDKCNLRCTYCMPADGMAWLPKNRLLTAEEIRRLVGIAVSDLGVREVRLTGGEPLVRKDLADIVAGLRADHPDLPLSLTTNAVGLAERAAELAAAGTDPHQRLPGHPPRRHLRHPGPAPLPGPRARRDRGRRGRRAGPAEDQRRPAARGQRRPGPRAGQLGPGPRPRAALHRADAVGRGPRLAPGEPGRRGRDPGAALRATSSSPPTRGHATAPPPNGSWWPRRPAPASCSGRWGSSPR